MDVVDWLLGLISGIIVTLIGLLIVKASEGRKQKSKKKQITNALYREISVLQKRLKELPDINSDLSLTRFQTATPIYLEGGYSLIYKMIVCF